MTKRKINQFVFIVLGLLAVILFSFSTLTSQTASSGLKNEGTKSQSNKEEKSQLMGHRFLTFASVVRIKQIETSRLERKCSVLFPYWGING
jgi:Na+-transporting methylmalonyl-CoA/oxaloacetate decarboxylase gamma subunit